MSSIVREPAATDVLIVGAGVGGVGVAAELRRLAPELRPELTVTLVSEQEEQLYRPWLIYVPPARLAEAETCVPLAPLAEREGFHLLLGKASQVDLAEKIVVVDDTAVAYRV